MNMKEKLKSMLEQKMNPQEMLKYLCPFEVDVSLKILANRNNHDYAILFKVTGDEAFIEDPKDLQAFITQVKAARKTDLEINVCKVNYDKEEYPCLYLDFKKE